jgi:hypothetical protein
MRGLKRIIPLIVERCPTVPYLSIISGIYPMGGLQNTVDPLSVNALQQLTTYYNQS